MDGKLKFKSGQKSKKQNPVQILCVTGDKLFFKKSIPLAYLLNATYKRTQNNYSVNRYIIKHLLYAKDCPGKDKAVNKTKTLALMESYPMGKDDVTEDKLQISIHKCWMPCGYLGEEHFRKSEHQVHGLCTGKYWETRRAEATGLE